MITELKKLDSFSNGVVDPVEIQLSMWKLI